MSEKKTVEETDLVTDIRTRLQKRTIKEKTQSFEEGMPLTEEPKTAPKEKPELTQPQGTSPPRRKPAWL